MKGTAKYQTTYQGASYYFSSASDLAVFKQNPAKYVPQYGGYYANHVRQKQLVDSDPRVFFIVNEKLYLCSSSASEKEFRSHKEENIKNPTKFGRELGGPTKINRSAEWHTSHRALRAPDFR